jgi:hypothetical protein
MPNKCHTAKYRGYPSANEKALPSGIRFGMMEAQPNIANITSDGERYDSMIRPATTQERYLGEGATFVPQGKDVRINVILINPQLSLFGESFLLINRKI